MKTNPICLSLWEKIYNKNVYIVGSAAYSYYFKGINPEDIDLVLEGSSEEDLQNIINELNQNSTNEDDLANYDNISGFRLKLHDEKNFIGYDIWVEPNLNNYFNKVGINIFAFSYNPKDGSFRCNEAFLNALNSHTIEIVDKDKLEGYKKPSYNLYNKLKIFINNGFNLSFELEEFLDNYGLR